LLEKVIKERGRLAHMLGGQDAHRQCHRTDYSGLIVPIHKNGAPASSTRSSYFNPA
jgi:hypothetical protein